MPLLNGNLDPSKFTAQKLGYTIQTALREALELPGLTWVDVGERVIQMLQADNTIY